MIKKASDYETEIKDKIMDIVDLIYNKMIAFRKDDYKHIKDDLLLEEKHLLKHKIDKSTLKMPKRNGVEKQFLKKLGKLIGDNKVNEAKYDSDDGEGEEDEEYSEE